MELLFRRAARWCVGALGVTVPVVGRRIGVVGMDEMVRREGFPADRRGWALAVLRLLFELLFALLFELLFALLKARGVALLVLVKEGRSKCELRGEELEGLLLWKEGWRVRDGGGLFGRVGGIGGRGGIGGASSSMGMGTEIARLEILFLLDLDLDLPRVVLSRRRASDARVVLLDSFSY